MRLRLGYNSLGLAITLAIALALTLTGGIATPASAEDMPLAGKVIVIDPGHQLGNSNPEFTQQMSQTRFNGYFVKGCNTTGTATNAGLPEATFTWKVARVLKGKLEAQGATVHMTRTANSRDLWGPCVWDRAGFANDAKADCMISIHGDGAPSSGRGFFVLAPGRIKGWTDDVVTVDRHLAKAMIAGMTAAGGVPSTYVADQLMIRKDQSTLNFSNVPTVIVEVGNMRNRKDAGLMSSAAGQRGYADWLLAGINRFFD